MKIVHYAGPVKPWNLGWNERSGEVEGLPMGEQVGFYALWWSIMLEHVQSPLARALQCAGGSSNAGVSDLIGRVTAMPVSDAQRGSWSFERIRGRMMDAVAKIQPPLVPPPAAAAAPPAAAAITLGPSGVPAAAPGAAGLDTQHSGSFEEITKRMAETMKTPLPK